MEIEKLINKRKAYLNRMKQLSQFALTTKTDVSKVHEFKIRCQDLDRYVEQFEGLHLDIVALATDGDVLAQQEEILNEFDDLQYSIKSIFREFDPIVSDVRSQGDVSDNVSESVSAPGGSGVIRQSKQNIRLPKIDIPKFDGSIRDWPSFFDLFTTLIHENDALSNIERFQYLVSSLTKEASSIVKNLPLKSENYQIAFDSLVSRYQNKRLLLTNYWMAIFHSPKIVGESPRELRDLLSVFKENLCALEQFHDHDLWDFTKFNLLLQRLDGNTRRHFELELGECEVPTYLDLYNFLEKHCKALETSEFAASRHAAKKVGQKVDKSSQRGTASFVTNYSVSCIYCKTSDHSTLKCDKFLELTPYARHRHVRQERLCFNCLGNHLLQDCSVKSVCRVCGKRHNTLLHFKNTDSGKVYYNKQGSGEQSKSSLNALTGGFLAHAPSVVLLSTVVMRVRDKQNRLRKCRALLDSASECSFMSEGLARELGLTRTPSSVPIQGLNQCSASPNLGTVTCSLCPDQRVHPSFELSAIVIPKICSKLPAASVSFANWKHIQGLPLADPNFGISGEIDVLLGADIYPLLLRPGFRSGSAHQPCAINTVFGWTLMGKCELGSQESTVRSFCTTDGGGVERAIQRFWEVEQVPQVCCLSEEDLRCEELFVQTCRRDKTGRYSVGLPFKEDNLELGESYSGALKRFLSLESKLKKNPDLYETYREFMQDYLDMGHMTMCQTDDTTTLKFTESYYIPHFCILRPESISTKLRVVFDASAKSHNGVSLNDRLLVGPTLQKDIVSILLVFRLHKVAFTADVRQMYRQILVAEGHRDFQRIVWRFSDSEPLQEYRLNTVTYGVSSSPFLAIRTLLQLACDEGRDFPLAAEVINNFIYVDDVVTGADSIAQAMRIKEQLTGMFAKGGFELRKWACNQLDLLDGLAPGACSSHKFSPDESDARKVLGLQWQPTTDCFSFCVTPIDRPATKRLVLSELARIYDPLGLLSPLTFLAKHIMQLTWQRGLDWDEMLPPDLLRKWLKYQSELIELRDILINRRILHGDSAVTEWHGFCDASERGYAAVVYLRQILNNGEICVSLVCAKSKVAPLKVLSVPRLELCAAVLLADLLKFVLTSVDGRVSTENVYAWSDSKVALSWIGSSPSRWKTFVANRVSHIQDTLDPNCWHHIDGTQNPADCASRGLYPSELKEHPQWWSGGSFLHSYVDISERATSDDCSADVKCEQRKVNVCVAGVDSSNWILLLVDRVSSFRKMQGTVAYCMRFINNSRSLRVNRVTGGLSSEELHRAVVTIVRVVQEVSFSEEIVKLHRGELCPKPFQRLSPFLDQDGVLRVGGRIRHSNLAYDAKHPMLLPRSHRFTELLIHSYHREHFHAGRQLLHYLLLQKFWILSARRAINHVLTRCNDCFKQKPVPIYPQMGDLPAVRISKVKPFSVSGVDLAGPYLITMGRHRGVVSSKAYVCLFICFTTKALHLELVSSLSSEAFLAAFRRFVARRGRCSELHSDCGTNFVGANKMLKNFLKTSAESLEIKWHFNPPSSPHFGGLWEAGVKSVKSHLNRVVGEHRLSYEEFNTLLAQIEALLNSRPLCSISSDPNDFQALTPGHFLTLEPLTAPPDEDLSTIKLNRLNRWQLIQRCHQDFWKKWHREYLHTLQQKGKWTKPFPNLAIGTLVIIIDEALPPTKWKLGRVLRVYCGKDDVVRVVQVRTATGTYDRPVVKLCPLPQQ